MNINQLQVVEKTMPKDFHAASKMVVGKFIPITAQEYDEILKKHPIYDVYLYKKTNKLVTVGRGGNSFWIEPLHKDFQ